MSCNQRAPFIELPGGGGAPRTRSMLVVQYCGCTEPERQPSPKPRSCTLGSALACSCQPPPTAHTHTHTHSLTHLSVSPPATTPIQQKLLGRSPASTRSTHVSVRVSEQQFEMRRSLWRCGGGGMTLVSWPWHRTRYMDFGGFSLSSLAPCEFVATCDGMLTICVTPHYALANPLLTDVYLV